MIDHNTNFIKAIKDLVNTFPNKWTPVEWQLDPDTFHMIQKQVALDIDRRTQETTLWGWPIKFILIQEDPKLVGPATLDPDDIRGRFPIVFTLVGKHPKTGRIRYHDHPECDPRVKD